MSGQERVGERLMEALGGARPASGAVKTQGAGSPGGVSFGALLEKAGAGLIKSDLPVRLARGEAIELSEDQLARLGLALDKAQSQGATNALVTIDGRAFEVDVLRRTVTREVVLDEGDVLTRIDAVVHAGGAIGAGGPEEAAKVVPVPGGGGLPRASKSVLEMLAKRAG
ncbi:MAG: hypothetical protein EA378_09870 [Phycisphaerales bacterium]|nr:MAG: hypothetical protein EA378_09870 [Phycisphaerales bacterium]